jgi:hypothetical protein
MIPGLRLFRAAFSEMFAHAVRRLGGLPRLAGELSYFLAANWRNHARMVAGLTI